MRTAIVVQSKMEACTVTATAMPTIPISTDSKKNLDDSSIQHYKCYYMGCSDNDGSHQGNPLVQSALHMHQWMRDR